ncbi:MAG: hypothetical protein AB8G86_18575 [Saprospiraceae bacterium]
MSLATRILVLIAATSLLWNCANQKILHPSPKIGFDINALDKDGLIGPADGKVAVSYEFCVPADNQYLNQVRQIDPSLQFHKKSKGRIACSKVEWLCIGNTHQEYAKMKLQQLAELAFVKRIERAYFE